MKLEGIFTALITPFKDGSVDISGLKKILKDQISNGMHGIVMCGTTGEAPSLSAQERKEIAKTAKEVCKDISIVVGTGSNNTKQAIEYTKNAKDAGADAALISTPYYNKPTQEGIYQHFSEIHDEVDIPIILYDVPSRAGCSMECETVEMLSKLERVVAIKDAHPDLLSRMHDFSDLGIDLLSGEDEMILPYWVCGGHGCVSVISNIAPKLCVDMYEAWKNGEIKKAREINKKLVKLSRVMFCESNPIPIKYAMHLKFGIENELRLPLTPAVVSSQEKIKEVMQELESGD